ncbi:MAG: M20 metallopeptidase family protein [Lachnospiraceae bacterium]
MDKILQRANELKQETINNRRYLHQNPELGLTLPVTSAYVQERLEEMGYQVERLGNSGLTALAGKAGTGKTILLRADMDALPMREESGLTFASQKEDISHCCGHDLHTAMLLTAAKIIKEQEDCLEGQVKFLFQPGEETGNGAIEMIAKGILETPKPDAVLAMHVNAKAPLGKLDYGKGITFCSNDNFEILIKGMGGHGARPHEAKDPLKTANYLYQALQTIRAGEISPMEPVILTITAINGGSTYNIIPDSVTMKGTLRTYNEDFQNKVLERIRGICHTVGELFNNEILVDLKEKILPLYCAPDFTDEILSYCREVLGAHQVSRVNEVKMGSEDFAFITSKYPETSGYLFIGAGTDEENGYPYGQHSSQVVFNEDVLPLGAAVMAGSAIKWLQNNGG